MAEPGLESIRHMLEQVLEGQRNHTRVLDEHTQRLGRIEREVVNLHQDFAGRFVRIDGVGDRLTGIERRIGLIEAS
jgi:hypothetical protein